MAHNVTAMLLPSMGSELKICTYNVLKCQNSQEQQRNKKGGRTQVEVRQKPSGNRMESGGKSVQSLMQGTSGRERAGGSSGRTEDRGKGDTPLSQEQTAYPLL